MVSKSDLITTNTRCSCGNGDTENNEENNFENVCPNCGRTGTLTVQNENIQVDDSEKTTDNTSVESMENKYVNVVVCSKCNSRYCGQDGYDLSGGTRGKLHYISADEVDESGDDEEVSTDEEGDTTYMSGWEGLCDLLKPLDAQAMMIQRGDYVIIRKIEMPQSAKLWAYEGINIVDDSVTITDYTPEIYNTFVIRWGESLENELEFTFNKHKELFGERKTVLEAKKVQVVSDENSEESEEKSEEDSGDWGITDLLFNADKVEDDLRKQNSGTDVSDLSNGDENSEAPETEEVNITDKDEAIQFGLTQVGKAKRDDGHTIELKVIGNQAWQVGEWCHVRLPSFNEDCYMFISKCSFESSPDNEYINSLTLVDYPPTLGKPSKSDKQDESESSEENTGEDNQNGDASENGDNTNTESSNNNNDNNNNG